MSHEDVDQEVQHAEVVRTGNERRLEPLGHAHVAFERFSSDVHPSLEQVHRRRDQAARLRRCSRDRIEKEDVIIEIRKESDSGPEGGIQTEKDSALQPEISISFSTSTHATTYCGIFWSCICRSRSHWLRIFIARPACRQRIRGEEVGTLLW
jgi:hypothetical protein